MNWVRKGFVHLLAIVLLAALLGGAVSTALNRSFGGSENIKTWLSESRIYDHVVDNTLDNAKDETGQGSTVAYDNPEVEKIAAATFSQQFVQQSANTFIDSNYDWLQGKTTTPSFSIDLTQPKQDFAEKIGQLVQTRLTELPVCSSEQLAKLQIPTDPLTVSCRPANLDPKVESSRVANEINNGNLIEQTVITADSLNNADGGEPYYTDLKHAPQTYSLIQKLPLVLAATALISVIGIFFIAPTRRRGLRRIGIMFLQAGLLLIAAMLASSFVNDKLLASLNKNTALEGELKQSYIGLFDRITTNIFETTTIFGVVFLLLSVVILIYLVGTRSRKPKTPKAAPTEKPQPKQQGAVNTPRLAPRPTNKPSMDVMAAPQTQVRPATPPRSIPVSRPGATSAATPPLKKKPRPHRPRLIQ